MEKIFNRTTLLKGLETLVQVLLVITIAVGFAYAHDRTNELLNLVSILAVSTVGTFITGLILA